LLAYHVAKKLGVKHMIKIYDLNQLADYVYDSIRLTDGFSVLNVSHMTYAMKMFIENNCHISSDGFVLETIGGSFMDLSMKNIETEFYSKLLRKSSVFDHREPVSVTGLRLKHKMRDDLMNLRTKQT
jgi:hypothetical protein